MDEHGLFLPCNIAGIIAVLALFLNELRDPNKLDTMAEPHSFSSREGSGIARAFTSRIDQMGVIFRCGSGFPDRGRWIKFEINCEVGF